MTTTWRDMAKTTLKKQTGTGQALTTPYEPTPYEQKMLAGMRARQAEKPPAPRITMNGRKLGLDHPHEPIGYVRLAEALGTDDLDFVSGALNQVINAASIGREPDERAINFMLSIITGIEPRDQVEAMLAMQMAAVHNATMTFARRLNHIENIPQQDSAERAFNKLARTFAAQVDALQRYRGKGQQRVTVEHVHVHQGGQAIVGAVQGGGVSRQNGDQPDAPRAVTHEPGAPMRSADQGWGAVPITGGSGKTSL